MHSYEIHFTEKKNVYFENCNAASGKLPINATDYIADHWMFTV